MPACPPADTLSRFLLDVLSGDEPAEVEAHVEHCGPCQESLRRMAQLAAQPATELMNSWHGGGREIDVPPAVNKLLQELSAVPFAVAAGMSDATGLDILPSTCQDEMPAEWPHVEGYEILGELGRGGMGVVYRARHLALDRLVALKMVLAGPARNPQARQRFQQEARAVGRLHHPNIIHVYDVGEQAGRPFLAMEMVDGGSLALRLGGRPQPPRAAARLIETLARAVQYAHSHGIVHRDLKPANVLLGRETEAWRGRETSASISSPQRFASPKITDFGLAKDLDADAPALTHSGAMLGTPSYMSPEQARCRGESVGPAGDVYGLGAILYELLTGRPPFRAATPLETLVQVVHSEPVPISRLEPSVPRDLATICQKCLEKEPVRRYASAEALAGDLRRFLADEPIVARPVGTIGRLRRWGRRNPALAGIMLAAAGIAAVALGTMLWQWREAVDARFHKDQALVAAQVERDAADDARRQAERASIGLRLDRGLSLCEGGETTAGLLWLARTLDEAAASGASDMEFALRANISAWAARVAVPQKGPYQPGIVTAMAYSADGRHLLTGRSEIQKGKVGPSEVQLWDLDGWRPVGRTMTDPDPLLSAACTPDGTRVVTCSIAGAVRVWDVATGAAITGPFPEAGQMTTVAVSPDGRRFAAGGINAAGQGEARIWEIPRSKSLSSDSADSDSESGDHHLDFTKQRVLPHAGRVNSIAFSPDGTAIVTGSSVPSDETRIPGGEAQIWDAATGAPRGRPLPHARPVTAVAVNPTGQVLLTGSADHVARLWNVETGRPVGIPRSHPFPVEMAAFCPDGKSIVTGGGWRSTAETICGAYLWDESTGRLLNAMQSYANVTFAGAIRPDGRAIATSSRDGHARLFDISGPKPLFERRQPVPISAAAFSPDGRLLLTGGGRGNLGQAQLWNLTSGELTNPPRDFDAPVVAVAFDPTGRTAVAGTRQGAIEAWDAANGQIVGPIQEAPPKLAPPVAALPTALDRGKQILMLFGREDSRRWKPAAGHPSASLPVLDKNVTAVAFSPDGRTIVIGDTGKNVRLWDVATGQFIGSPRAAGGIPWHVTFNPDGTRFLTVTGDGAADWGKVQVWDGATATAIGPPLPPRVAVTAVAFRPDGREIAAGGRDGNVRLWDGPTGKPLGPTLYHSGAVRAVAFDSVGQRLAVTGADGTIRVWPVPETMSDLPAEVRRRIEKLTGYELDAYGGVRALADVNR